MTLQVYMASNPDSKLTPTVILQAHSSDSVKRQCQHILLGDPDKYVITPLVPPGKDVVFILGGRNYD